MAEHYRFFNSMEEDLREYLAADFAEYFSLFLSDGLYAEDGRAGLKVVPAEGLKVEVAPGYAFIRGYMYHNDAPLVFDLAPADTILDRLDRVVLRFDEVAREIKLTVTTGEFSSTPAAPDLEESSTIKELGLAQVLVKHGTNNILTKDIIDERLTAACGLVASVIEIPAQEMWDVWNQALAGIGADWLSWFESVQETLGTRIMIGESEPPEIETGDLWFKVV